MKRIFVGLLLVLAPTVASADKTWNAGKGTTWNCKKDPIIRINHGKATYTFKGACTSLNLNGANVKIKAESFDAIHINGANNDVTVGTVGEINVTGTKNSIKWKQAKSGDAPAVNDLGKDNVIAQAGGATKPPATTAPTPPATTPPQDEPAAKGAIDCAKQPSHELEGNDATFTFIGTCDKIELSGNANKVKVENVKSLEVIGNDNKVEAVGADSISTVGNANKVSYKKGIAAAKPTISNVGSDNKITKVK